MAKWGWGTGGALLVWQGMYRVCEGGTAPAQSGSVLPRTQTPAMAPDGRKANLLGSEWRRASKGLFLYPARLCAVFQLQSAPLCAAPGKQSVPKA